MFKLIARIVAAFAIGLVFCLWIIQNAPQVKNLVSTKIVSFIEKEWSTKITVESININFFTCSLYVKKAQIIPSNDKQYAWGFDQCRVYISPLKLLFKKKVSLDLTFNNLKASTRYANNKADLAEHIQDIFTPKSPNLRITAKGLALNNVELDVTIPNTTTDPGKPNHTTYSLHIPGSFTISKKKNPDQPQQGWNGSLLVTHATIARNNVVLGHHLENTTSFYQDAITKNWHFTTKTQGTLPLLDDASQYTLEGSWEPAKKCLTLKDTASNTNLSGTLTDANQLLLQGHLPVPLITRLAQFVSTGNAQQTFLMPAIGGTCALDVALWNHNNHLATSGSILFSDLSCANVTFQKLALKLASDANNHIFSDIDVVQSPQAHLNGAFSWDWTRNAGSLTLTNTSALTIPFDQSALPHASWKLGPNDLRVKIALNDQSTLKGTYRCTITNQATEKRFPYKGVFVASPKAIGLQGSTVKGNYTLRAALAPNVHITQWRYRVGDKDFVNLAASPHNPSILHGSIRWAFLRSFLDQQLKYFIFNNKCVLSATLDQSDINHLHGTIKLAEGRFFIPDFHNLINAMKVSVDINVPEKKVVLSDMTLALSKGTISCPRATMTLNQDLSVRMLHVPLTIDDTFINWKRDFYGSAYGNLLLNKIPECPTTLSGTLVLKKSLLKDTFFTRENAVAFQGPMSSVMSQASLPIGLDIRLITQKPLRAKTPSIEANAAMDITINHTPHKDFASAPHITGNINLQSGSLKFFHNRLHINYGKIQFVAGNMNDPLIDLIAKNRVGKYLVQLQVTGSLQKPTILLESTPDLTEEQIIGLLLTGSERSSLRNDLPLMLLQNLDSFIFDSRKSAKNASWFDKISKTFKYVQITPNLTDEANPTKLKGSISVNLNDQLRAQIQKNLDLEKDFSAQLEYALSDDINLKFVRDQRGELGSEIEMRLKLG